eukprot:762521-Hanusia_phi.AAC.18
MRSPPSVDHINEDRKLSSGCVIVHLLDRKRDRDSSCEHAGDSESLQASQRLRAGVSEGLKLRWSRV